jgi:DNA polymerase-3 subunit alpha
MPAVAMTDHANLMGAFHFVRDILNHKAKLKSMQKIGEGPGGSHETYCGL